MRKLILVAAALAFHATSAGAQSLIGVAAGPHVSTLGLGADASVKMNDFLVMRLSGNYFRANRNDTYDGISYDVRLSLASAGALLDYHPFAGGLLVSAGVYWNGNGADFSATPTTNVVIGNTSFTPAEVGRISATLEYQQIAPYIGIRYDTAHHDILPFALRIRAGLFYMGKANVSMSTSGTLSSNAAFLAELAREEQNLEEDFDILGFYPAITIGFSVRF